MQDEEEGVDCACLRPQVPRSIRALRGTGGVPGMSEQWPGRWVGRMRRGVADHTHFWVPGCSGPIPDIFGGLGSRVCRIGKASEGD